MHVHVHVHAGAEKDVNRFGNRTQNEPICVRRGTDFHSGICQATSNTSRLYWRVNSTHNIFSDDDAVEFDFNITQKTGDDGRINRTLTAKNMQYRLDLECLEGERVLSSYSLDVKDVCDPPTVTGLCVVILRCNKIDL